MRLSQAGVQIRQDWEEIPHRYPGAVLDTLIVMPDHLHAIISLPGDALSLPELIHHLKARTTAQYALRVHEQGWPPFHGKLWQRGFYERVIRQDEELTKMPEYILQNPLRWSLKKEAE